MRLTIMPCAMLAFASVLLIPCVSAWSDDVVPDGTTRTSATHDSNGHITVRIAPPSSNGTSLNRYRDFNVPPAGVTLRNRDANAAVIVNEVTSTRRSSLRGTLAVDGAQAHVIVANPNGITVDGGRFVGTGGVALITGRARMENGSVVGFDVDGGAIEIGRAGLGGTMTRLDLIAKTIRIEGRIAADQGSGAPAVDVSTGSVSVRLSPSRPADQPEGWVTTTSKTASSNEVSVVISGGGVLSGGRIRITANDRGAGVRMAGNGLASTGSFWITATGEVVVEDAVIEAKEDVFLSARSIAISSKTRQASIRSVDSGILVEARKDIRSDGVTYRGKLRSQSGFGAAGAVALHADGAVTLRKSGGFESRFTADEDALDFTAGTVIDDRGGIFRTSDQILMSGKGGIRLEDSDMAPAGNVRLVSDGALSVRTSKVIAGDSIIADVGSVSLRSANGNRTRLEAVNGGVFLKAGSGDVLNEGALVQGTKQIKGLEQDRGAVTVLAPSGRVVNRTLSPSEIAAFYAREDDLHIEAGKGVRNASGRFLSNRSVKVRTAGAFSNVTAKTIGNVQRVVSSRKRRHGGWLGFLFRPSFTLVHDYGRHLAGIELSTVTAIDAIDIEAGAFENIGGELSADRISITATHFFNRPSLFGRAELRARCRFLRCSYDGSANVYSDGGTIIATDALDLSISGDFLSEGGRLLGYESMVVQAPQPVITALLVPNVYIRGAGLHSGAFGTWGRIFYGFENATVGSQNGLLMFDSRLPVTLAGVAIVSRDPLLARAGIEYSAQPKGLREKNATAIGFLAGWLPFLF